MAAIQNILVRVFSSLLHALLVWWKTIMMYEVSLPLSPNTGRSVRDWGVVIVHIPESQADVWLLHGAWS